MLVYGEFFEDDEDDAFKGLFDEEEVWEPEAEPVPFASRFTIRERTWSC